MARSKSFFNQRSGSTRELTFYVQDGEQITRSRVSHIKNPRSIAQMQQRMIMATCMAAYKGMKVIVDHSWEGVDYGAKSFQRFMSVNSKLMRNESQPGKDYHFARFHERQFFFGIFQMSEGSLLTVNQNIYRLGDVVDSQFVAFDVSSKDIFGEPLLWSNRTLMNQFNLNAGDSLTLVMIGYTVDQVTHFFFLRFTFLSDSDVPWNPDNIDSLVKIDKDVSSDYLIPREDILLGWLLKWPVSNDLVYCAGTYIVSKRDGDQWLRSTSYMQPACRLGDSRTYQDALDTYPIRHIYTLNGQQSL